MSSVEAEASGLPRREASTPRCGAKRRKEPFTPCTLPAGWGTDTPGFGVCKLHGGGVRNHRLKAGREAALQHAKDALGKAIATDPLDAQLLAVALGRGMVEFWRMKVENEAHPAPSTLQGYRLAVLDLSRTAGRATDSRVAERIVSITERQAEALVGVIEGGLKALIEAGVTITNPQRTAFAAAIQSGLKMYEDDGAIEGDVLALPVATG